MHTKIKQTLFGAFLFALSGIFFLGLDVPQAQALLPRCDTGTATIGPGTCKASCTTATETQENHLCETAGQVCCVPKPPTTPTPPAAAACTGSCRSVCGPTETAGTGACTTGLRCCMSSSPTATPAPGGGGGTPVTPAAAASGDCSAGFESVNGICIPDNTGLSKTPIQTILSNFMLWLFGIFGSLAIIAFVISGLQYLTALGDEKQAEKAKENAKYAVLGVIVALSGFIIIIAVSQALNANPNF